MTTDKKTAPHVHECQCYFTVDRATTYVPKRDYDLKVAELEEFKNRFGRELLGKKYAELKVANDKITALEAQLKAATDHEVYITNRQVELEAQLKEAQELYAKTKDELDRANDILLGRIAGQGFVNQLAAKVTDDLQSKLALAEKRLSKCKEQRNQMLEYPADIRFFCETLPEEYDKELEEIKV